MNTNSRIETIAASCDGRTTLTLFSDGNATLAAGCGLIVVDPLRLTPDYGSAPEVDCPVVVLTWHPPEPRYNYGLFNAAVALQHRTRLEEGQ